MSTLVLTYRAIHHKFKAVSLPNINWKLFYALGIGVSLLLAVFYVFNVNQLTNGAYLIKSYSKEIDSLSRETKSMAAESVESGFLDQIHIRASGLGFEKVSEIKYIEMESASLAKWP